MVVVEKHERKSEWWSAAFGNMRVDLDDDVISIMRESFIYDDDDNYKPIMALLPREWPELRAAIDALYAVWQEQREAGE